MTKYRPKAALAVAAVLLVATFAMPAVPSGSDSSTAGTPTPTPQFGSVATPAPQGQQASVPQSHVQETVTPASVTAPSDVRASAGSQTMRVSTVRMSGRLGLRFTDNRTHDGRTVSLPVTWFQQHYSEIPERAWVRHESGNLYPEPVAVTNGRVEFQIQKFSTNTVMFAGEVSIASTGAADGSSFSYDINDLDSTSSPNMTLTGVENTQVETITADNQVDGDTFSHTIAGNKQATDVSVTFTGDSNSTDRSPSGVDGDTLSVGGNLEPTGPSANGEPTVTLEGDGSTTANDQSATNVNPTGSSSISVTGNLDPVGPSANNLPEITVTGNKGAKTNYDGSTEETDWKIYGKDIDTELTVENVPAGTITAIRLPDIGYNGCGSDTAVDVYIADEGLDGTYTDGTKAADSVTPPTDYGGGTIQLDTPVSVSGGVVTVQFVSVGTDSVGCGGEFDKSPSGTVFYGSSYRSGPEEAHPRLVLVGGPAGVSVADGTGNSATVGDLDPGASTTTELAVSKNATAVDFSASTSGSGALGTVDYTLDKDDREGTKDPGIDIDGDGTDEKSTTGVYQSGETVTFEIASLSTGSRTVSTSSASGPLPSWQASFTERSATEDPAIDVDSDGTVDYSHSGVLKSGETATRSLSDLPTGSHTAGVSLTDHQVDVSLSYTERTVTDSPGVEVNGGNWLNTTGTLSDGQTVEKTGDSTWLQSGTNRVNVSLADSLSADAPTMQVGLEYNHSASDQQSVSYDDEAWSEGYNVSKTYASDRAKTSLEVPFASSKVVSVRSVEYRVNESGGWSSVSSANYALNATTLTVDLAAVYGGEIPAGSTIEVRTTGSKVKVSDGEITVTQATPAGSNLDTRIRLDSWNSDATIAVQNDSQGTQLHYVANETYGSPQHYARIQSDDDQRLHLPSASTGDLVTVRTLPLDFDVQSNQIDVWVPENRTNATEPVYEMDAGPNGNDEYSVTFLDAKDGEEYILYDESRDVVLDRGTASSPLTLSDDDDDTAVMQFRLEDSTSASIVGDGGGGGGAILDSQQGTDLPSAVGLLAIALGIAGLLVVSRASGASDVADTAGDRVEAAAGNVPGGDRAAGPLGSVVEQATAGIGMVLANRTVALGLAGGLGILAIEAGFVTLPPDALVPVVVAGIALFSFVALREVAAFSTSRWVGIVGAATLVALQVTADTSLIAAVTESRVFPLLAIGGLYLAYQALQQLRQSGGGDGDQTVTVRVEDGDQGGD
jgi:hypothetical protein